MGVSERDLIGLCPHRLAWKRGHPYQGVRFQALPRWLAREHIGLLVGIQKLSNSRFVMGLTTGAGTLKKCLAVQEY